MKTTILNFKGIAFALFISLLVLALSACSSYVDEPTMTVHHDKATAGASLLAYNDNTTATILVLHKDSEYGRNHRYLDKAGVSWKAFPNSEETIDLYLKPDGFISVWNGENASNFTMGYNVSADEAIIQPWPYIGLDGTVLNKDERRNVYSMEFQGEDYYMFNPVIIDLPSQNPTLINYRNGNQIRYITLFCDYVTYGTHQINNFEPEDEEFYMYSHLPLPAGGVERNKIYIYILNDGFNFFEHGRRAGIYTEAASIYTVNHPNDKEMYSLIEYSPETDTYIKLQ